jgi:hypothetical protein
VAVIRYLLGRLRDLAVMESERAEYPSTFSKELNYQCGRILLFASLITIVAWLPYLHLDRLLHPEEPILPFIRMGLSFVSLTVLILYIS